MDSCKAATNLPVRAKADAWSDAALNGYEFGPLHVTQLTCDRCTIDHAPQHIASGRVYTLILQARGRGVFMQYGHEAELGAGDFTLCHGEVPYTYQLGDACEVVMVRVPASLLKEHLPGAESFCGRRLAANEGLSETAAAMMFASLCAGRSAGLSPQFEHRVARQILSLIATSYAIAFESKAGASSNVDTWRARVRLYIEQHLRTPDLTPCSIAQKLKLSPRYLRMIFASGNETTSAYILRRRLEECARQMEDPRWSGRSITELAFSWGFNSAPHFTRSFRDRYGTSPRHYRDQQGLKSRPSPAPSSRAALAPLPDSPAPGPALPEPGESF